MCVHTGPGVSIVGTPKVGGNGTQEAAVGHDDLHVDSEEEAEEEEPEEDAEDEGDEELAEASLRR